MTPSSKAPIKILLFSIVMRLLPLVLLMVVPEPSWAAPTKVAPNPAAPIIFNSSTMAGPGDIINLQGQYFGERPRVLCSIDGARPIGLSVVNHSDGIVHARLPATSGLYKLWIKDGAHQSNCIAINQPRAMHATVSEVSTQQKLTIYGRNLNLRSKSYQPKVLLIARSGKAHYEAQIVNNPSASELVVTIPRSIDPGEYTLALTNGLSSEQSSSTASDEPIHISVVSAEKKYSQYNVKTDPRLKLHAVGDGKTN